MREFFSLFSLLLLEEMDLAVVTDLQVVELDRVVLHLGSFVLDAIGVNGDSFVPSQFPQRF